MGAEIREMTEALHEELYQLRTGCYPEDEPEDSVYGELYIHEDFAYMEDADEGVLSPEYDDYLYDHGWDY